MAVGSTTSVHGKWSVWILLPHRPEHRVFSLLPCPMLHSRQPSQLRLPLELPHSRQFSLQEVIVPTTCRSK